MRLKVPARLAANCAKAPDRTAWLERLPEVIEELRLRWDLDLGSPFDSQEVSAAWVAPARRRDSTPVVFKVSMPHLEADHEAAGLRLWGGHPTVRLLDADDGLGRSCSSAATPGHGCERFPKRSRISSSPISCRRCGAGRTNASASPRSPR